jgi:hypothetical protein
MRPAVREDVLTALNPQEARILRLLDGLHDRAYYYNRI